uniref:protein-serine/threonine phosphatase n=1 Tax=Panagrolaimus superbus TaxID=310955 RepID=A0A914Y264_9BILA
MPASAELDITEKSHTIRALNSKSSTTDNNKLEQEGLVEPKEITQSGSGSREDERQKAKAQIEEIVNRLMKNPNEPNKAMLTTDDIISVIIRAREVLMLDAALIELEAPIVIVGDLHGQFSDAMAIFSQNGFPPSQKYLFLGDYIDRGEYSTETVVLLLGLKLLHPDSIFLLRGNQNVEQLIRFMDSMMKWCRDIILIYGNNFN